MSFYPSPPPPTPPRRSPIALAAGFAAVLLAAALPAPPAAPQSSRQAASTLDRAQDLIDRGEAEAALALLEPLAAKKKPEARTLLLRSTALIMTGETAAGFADLEQALVIDPGLRQGWLNLAGLEIAEGHYAKAYDALLKAQKLDPDDPDNHLNLGAVKLFQGELEPARDHFALYLAAHPDSAEAAYLVAANYALGGHEPEAVEHLRQAVALDERMRLRARSDERFVGLSGDAYRELLRTDTYSPPADARSAAAAFKKPYHRTEPDLVYAVLEALKENGIEYDPSIEATDDWALIWGAMRIKVYTQENGSGVVSLSAPPDRFTADEWQRRTEALFRSIYAQLENAQ